MPAPITSNLLPSAENAASDALPEDTPSATNGGAGQASPAPDPSTVEWQELRELLLRPEQQQLARFTSAEHHAQEVSEVLPQAITLRTKRDRRLAKALQPTLDEALRVSIKKDPKPFLDAVTPVMGAAIRRAIAEALSGMLESLNRTLDNSISPRSLQWRWEAFRTGKPFSEIVFLNTVAYRVEQVFLIHKETGLLLQHVENTGGAIEDADMVSGMLTAIQDFVRDSFRVSTGETLDTMKVGELTVWVEQGPQALLAGVVRGAAPPELRLVLQDALDSIHLDFHHLLQNFTDDATPFAECRPYLQACLQVRYQKKTQQAGLARLSQLKFRVGVGLILLSVFGFFYLRGYLRWRGYLTALRQQPGITVINASYGFFGSRLEGLRDPLAADPDQLLQSSGLNPANVTRRWAEYQALDADFILQRARWLLEPPDGVKLSLKQGTLYAEGAASREWLNEARKMSRALAGVRAFVSDQDTVQNAIAQLEAQTIAFPLGRADLTPDNLAQVKLVADAWQRITQMQPATYYVEVAGNADPTGTPQVNTTLKRDRAAAVRQALIDAGCAAEQIQLATVAPQNADAARRVSFRVRPK